MSIWKTYNLPLSEFCLGNLFYHVGVDQVTITGIHISGRIQVAKQYSGEVYEIASHKELKPIDLPTGSNDSQLEYWLRNTEFKKIQSGHYEMLFDGFKIKLAHQMLKERWVLMYDNDDTNLIIVRPIQHLHELQNAFTFITKSRLSII